MKKIGITGNIGGGKSEVTSYLKSKGYKVLDADKIVAEIYFDNNFINEMKTVFKQYDISEGENLDKKKIGKIVFENQLNLDILNSTIAPYINKKLNDEINYYAQTEKLIFLDIPLLFEKNMQTNLDAVILVYCEDKIRFERASLRDLKKIDEIEKIDSFQMNQTEKRKLADYVVDNSDSKENLYVQIEEVLKKIIDQR